MKKSYCFVGFAILALTATIAAGAHFRNPSPTLPTVFGMNATDWSAVTALATVLLVVATGWIALVARNQIASLREENMRGRTIVACERFDLDPVLGPIVKQLTNARRNKSLRKNPIKYEYEINALLNYFEQLAIGAKQQDYSRQIMCSYLDLIMEEWRTELIDSGVAAKIGSPTPKYFSEFVTLCDELLEQRNKNI